MSLNFAVWSPFYRDLSLRSSHAWGVPSGKNDSHLANRKASGNQARHRGKWNYKTFSLQWYFTPFHNFKDLKIFVAEIFESREVFIFIGRDGRGSQNREILSPAGNITGMYTVWWQPSKMYYVQYEDNPPKCTDVRFFLHHVFPANQNRN
jgi:hypothetical protein